MPEGDLFRAWLYQLRRLAGDCPLPPGSVRINVGMRRSAVATIQHSLRRDGIPVESVDCRGLRTQRMVIDGITLEWFAGPPLTEPTRTGE